MKNDWEKQFDKKFNYPKTLWARDANGKVWYHKQDVKNFIRDLLDEQKKEIEKDILTVGVLLKGNIDRQKIINFINKYLLK